MDDPVFRGDDVRRMKARFRSNGQEDKDRKMIQLNYKGGNKNE